MYKFCFACEIYNDQFALTLYSFKLGKSFWVNSVCEKREKGESLIIVIEKL